MEALLNFVKEQAAGMVMISWVDDKWNIAVRWGIESPESGMTEVAAYGAGETLEEAVDAVRRDIEG